MRQGRREAQGEVPTLDAASLFFFLTRTFCDRFRRGPGATANYSTRRVRDLSPRWQAAGSRCIQPSRVLQDLVHSRRAGSRGDCVKRELEQRAGEGPLRAYGNDAAPAGHVGCTQGRADGSVRARSACLCKEPQEGRGFRAPAATNLDGENHKVAALRARQLGVGVATLAPCCELKREAGSGVGALPRLARASDGADASGVDSKLRPVPKGQAVAHYLDPSCIGYRDREIHVGKAHVAGDSCPSLLADPGDSSLKRKGAGSQGTGVGTCCSMVTERVKRPAACRDSRGEWQRQAQAAKQEHSKLCGGDGDCFVCGADREATGGVRGGEMHLERVPVAGTGGVPLPASEASARLGFDIFGRRAWGLRGIPGGDVAALCSEVGRSLCCSCNGG